jgi:hypothetical protein
MVFALVVVFLLIVLVVILTQGTKEQLRSNVPPRDVDRRSVPDVPRGMTAAEMLQRVDALDKANAQWPEIWE